MGIKKGDTVIVLSGKNKGKKGKVINVFPDKGKVIVEGVGVVKKHQKPTRNFQGGIIEKPVPIYSSKVMLVCPRCGKLTRSRTCKKCGEKV